MNRWTELSIELANQRNDLDQQFRVYPCIPEGLRDIDEAKWESVENAFKAKKNKKLVKALLSLDLFPVKDSYVAYLRRDPSSLERNPETVNRLCGRFYELGLNQIFERCSEPKETNRQMGPRFHEWIKKGSLGVPLVSEEEFLQGDTSCILGGSESQLLNFARNQLGYTGDKSPDIICKFNEQYVIGEAKFLTDFGGHQNAQFEDAKRLLENKAVKAIKIAVLDGVLFIPGGNKMHQYLIEHSQEYNIMSVLVLREFLYQI